MFEFICLNVEKTIRKTCKPEKIWINYEVLVLFRMIKQNEERVIRRLASQLESNPGDLQHKIGRQLKSSERRMKKVG